MTDEYYRGHGNSEIGTQVTEDDSLERKILAGLIWQAEGGLDAFMEHGEDYILNQTTENLAAALEKEGVSDNRIRLIKQLTERSKEVSRREQRNC